MLNSQQLATLTCAQWDSTVGQWGLAVQMLSFVGGTMQMHVLNNVTAIVF